MRRRVAAPTGCSSAFDDSGSLAFDAPDRARAVSIFRSLSLPDWEMGTILARWLREDPDLRVRLAAVWSPSHAIAGIESLPPRDAILEALADDPAESVRAAAAEALAPFLMDTDHDPAMAGAIVRALAAAVDGDPSWRVRMEAARNLGLAAPTEEEAQGVRSRQVTRHAALGQSSAGNEVAVAALVRAAVDDPRYDVRSAACHSLQNVAAAVPAPHRPAPIGVAGNAGSRGPGSAIGRQAGRRGGGAGAARRAPRRARGRDPPTARAGPLLADHLEGSERLDRALAARCATQMTWSAPRSSGASRRSGPSAAPLIGQLAECLGCGDDSLREYALEALTQMGPAAASGLPAVVEQLDAPAVRVRLLAAKAVWAIGGEGPHLAAVLDTLERIAGETTRNASLGIKGQLKTIAAQAAGRSSRAGAGQSPDRGRPRRFAREGPRRVTLGLPTAGRGIRIAGSDPRGRSNHRGTEAQREDEKAPAPIDEPMARSPGPSLLGQVRSPSLVGST